MIHEPELLAKPRYVAIMEASRANFDEGQKARWAECLKRAISSSISTAWMPQACGECAELALGTGHELRHWRVSARRTGLDKSDILFTTASACMRAPGRIRHAGIALFLQGRPYLNAEKQAHRYERIHRARTGRCARVLVVGLGSLGATIAQDWSRFGVDVWGTRRRSDIEAPDGVSRMIDQRYQERTA